MKRSEMVGHIAAELEEMLSTLEARPKTRPYITDRFANNLLDMLEGFGMLPPVEDPAHRHDLSRYIWDYEDGSFNQLVNEFLEENEELMEMLGDE